MQQIYHINNLPRSIPLHLGVQSEYGARPIAVDVSEWLKSWPDMDVKFHHVRPSESADYNPADVTREGNVITWTPDAYDTEIPGSGSLELVGMAPGVRIISPIIATTIENSRSFI